MQLGIARPAVGTRNLTGSCFVSLYDGSSPRREIEPGAQQCPRKWTSERIKSPARAVTRRVDGRNFIMDPADSAGICTKFADRNVNAKQAGDNFRKLRLIRLKLYTIYKVYIINRPLRHKFAFTLQRILYNARVKINI